MRASLGRLYQGLQAASVLYVLATLALPAPAEPSVAVSLLPAPTPAEAPDVPAGPAEIAPAPEPVALAAVPTPAPEPEPSQVPARPKPAIGLDIPEGHFDFDPAGAAAAVFGKPEGGALPFAPPAAELPIARTGPPVIYRRGRISSLAGISRNRHADSARARAFAFDDRLDPPPAFGGLDPAFVSQSWKRDVAQFRSLRAEGHSEDELRERLGDRFSSVRWAALLDAAVDRLPPPTDSYAAALKREQKQQARRR